MQSPSERNTEVSEDLCMKTQGAKKDCLEAEASNYLDDRRESRSKRDCSNRPFCRREISCEGNRIERRGTSCEKSSIWDSHLSGTVELEQSR